MSITALPTPPSRADAANFSTRADAFLGALPTFVTEANATATQVNTDAATASAAAATAVASPNTQGTSTTSLSITVASKTATVETGKSFVANMWIAFVDTADGTRWMAGPATSYNSGTGQLIVDVQRTSGTGTTSSWRVYGINPMVPDSAPRVLATGSTIKDSGGVERSIGFLGAPPKSITASHVLTVDDCGFTLEVGSGGSITVPLHSTTAFPTDAIILVRNMTSSVKSITPAAGVTLHWSGSTSTGARNLKAWGDAAISFTSVNDDVRVKGDLT